MFLVSPHGGRPESWQLFALLSYGFAVLSLPIWAISASSRWLIPFAIFGAVALALGGVSLYQLKRLPGMLLTRCTVLPAPLAGALALMKLEYWWEKFS
jgi:hypothetical protein